jgi:hypothetical protein
MSKLQDTAGPTFHISDKAYAASILRDSEREAKAANAASQECFACGRSFTGTNADNRRFCSARCQEAFDAGLVGPHQEQAIKYTWLDSRPMHLRGDRFLIPCAHCKREFVSKGLRCCSTECERKFRERKDIAETVAGHAVEGSGHVKRKCEKCGDNIPRWTGAGTRKRATPKGTRFCSRKCREAA